MNTSLEQKQTHIHREQIVVAKGEGVWGRDAPGIQDEQTEAFIYRMDKQQGPTL